MSDDQIASIVQRVQRLQEEKRTIEDDIREVYQEARANGYDVKVLRAVVKHLGKDQDDVAEFDALFELYLQAVTGAHGAPRATPAIAQAVPTYPERVSRPATDLETSKDTQARQISAPAGNGADQLVAEAPPSGWRLPPAKPLRPHCLKPDRCGSYGSKHCDKCERAHAGQTEAA